MNRKVEQYNKWDNHHLNALIDLEYIVFHHSFTWFNVRIVVHWFHCSRSHTKENAPSIRTNKIEAIFIVWSSIGQIENFPTKNEMEKKTRKNYAMPLVDWFVYIFFGALLPIKRSTAFLSAINFDCFDFTLNWLHGITKSHMDFVFFLNCSYMCAHSAVFVFDFFWCFALCVHGDLRTTL